MNKLSIILFRALFSSCLAHAQWTLSGTNVYTTSSTVNVGLGTTAPAEKLIVVGSIGVRSDNSTISIDDGATTSARLGFVKKNGADPHIASGSATAIIFSQSNQAAMNLNISTATYTERMRIAVGGNVGIGTTAPLAKLHVSGSTIIDDATPYLYTGSLSSEQNRYLHLGNSPSTTSGSGLKAGGVLIADTYTYANPGKNNLVVKGTVGIGTPLTSNPNNYLLAVNGAIGAKDVRIENSTSTIWPDYVFEAEYELPSLQEVVRFRGTTPMT